MKLHKNTNVKQYLRRIVLERSPRCASGKIAYLSKQSAEDFANTEHQQFKENMRAYLCGCGYWHLSDRNKRKRR